MNIETRLNKMETFFDQKEVNVIDNGTGFIKYGYSGEDLPRVSFSCLVCDAYSDVDQGNPRGSSHRHRGGPVHHVSPVTLSEKNYGNEALQNKHEKNLHYPVQRGIVEEYDHMKDLWEQFIDQSQRAHKQETYVLITDYPLNTKEKKIKTAEIMFEHLGVKYLSIMNSAVLSLFSTGRTSGLVIESGQGVTNAVPIFEGYALPHAIQTVDIAG